MPVVLNYIAAIKVCRVTRFKDILGYHGAIGLITPKIYIAQIFEQKYRSYQETQKN